MAAQSPAEQERYLFISREVVKFCDCNNDLQK